MQNWKLITKDFLEKKSTSEKKRSNEIMKKDISGDWEHQIIHNEFMTPEKIKGGLENKTFSYYLDYG